MLQRTRWQYSYSWVKFYFISADVQSEELVQIPWIKQDPLLFYRNSISYFYRMVKKIFFILKFVVAIIKASLLIYKVDVLFSHRNGLVQRKGKKEIELSTIKSNREKLDLCPMGYTNEEKIFCTIDFLDLTWPGFIRRWFYWKFFVG